MKKNQYFLEIISCDPSIYAMDHLDLTVSNFMEDPIGLQRVDKRGIQLASFLASPYDRVPTSSGNHGKPGNHKKVHAWKIIEFEKNHGKIMEFCEIIGGSPQ